jgi:antitoxin HicB
MNEYRLVVAPLSHEDGGGFIGFFPDLPGCTSDGETREEATKNAEEALAAWLEVQHERQAQVPDPGAASAEMEEEREQMIHAIARLTTELESARDRIKQLESASSGWTAPKDGRRTYSSQTYGAHSTMFRPTGAVA